MASRRGKSNRGKGKDKPEIADRASLAYKILSENQTNELMEITSPEELEKKVCEILTVTEIDVDLKQSALLDYYVITFDWARTQKFTAQQVSGFFTLCHMLLENIKEKNLSRVDNLKELKKLLAGVGVDNPEITGGLDFFTVEQAKNILDYLSTSFFKHYHLYQFVFLQPRTEEILGLELGIDVPKAADIPWPPPLDESISEAVYMKYIATPPPTAVPEEESTENADDLAKAEMEQQEADIVSKLSSDEIKAILDSVCQEMLGSFEAEIAQKLYDREASFLSRINKIHKVAET